ncbi:MAG TPA: universal stress protein [Burkholderiales bacterium]|nr:universal stress protein [Burkholderiales bacterium]
MFKHILLPTDGSPLSEGAVLGGIGLARALGARVTALHVIPPFHLMTYRPGKLEQTREEYEQESAAVAEGLLAFVAKAAADRGVACETLIEGRDDIYRAIIDVAMARACDLIVMASHGRRGIAGLLMGSQTQHVLTHGRIPVLVWR